MAVKQTAVSKPVDPPMMSFPVIVESTIGHIAIGEGDQHPFAAALAMIADHQLNVIDYADATYRFAGEDGGAAVVEIHHEHPNLHHEPPNR
jgi:hypothetical protein